MGRLNFDNPSRDREEADIRVLVSYPLPHGRGSDLLRYGRRKIKVNSHKVDKEKSWLNPKTNMR